MFGEYRAYITHTIIIAYFILFLNWATKHIFKGYGVSSLQGGCKQSWKGSELPNYTLHFPTHDSAIYKQKSSVFSKMPLLIVFKACIIYMSFYLFIFIFRLSLRCLMLSICTIIHHYLVQNLCLHLYIPIKVCDISLWFLKVFLL